MEPNSEQFFRSLLETPSPSGYEEPIQAVVRQYAASFADEVRTDLHGNLIAIINPAAEFRIMLAGHCDQIGFIITHIDDDGFLFFQPIGGWDAAVVLGQCMTVWTQSGPCPGVVARKAIHLLKDDERNKAVKLTDLWIDIGAANKAEVTSRVRIGDPVTLRLGMTKLPNDLAYSPGMDDKTGLWVVMEALRRAKQAGAALGVYAVSTVQEEVGLRGARTAAGGILPQVGIAVDVTHATDCPSMDKKQEGDVRLGRGPVIYRGPNMNPRVVEHLLTCAERKQITYQLAAEGRATGTDANSIQISGAGVATGLVSIPNRYMHSPVEMVSLRDIDAAANLLAEFCLTAQGAAQAFVPGH